MDGADGETIAGVAARLAFWGSHAPKGLARVEFDSEYSRRDVEAWLRTACAQAALPFHAVALPLRLPAVEVVHFLTERLAPLPRGVVSLSGWATAFPADVPPADSLRVLNYNRENLSQYPLCQIWWMTRDFSDALLRTSPDLASWFIVRLRLAETLPPPRDETPPSGPPASSPEQQGAARRRSADLAGRFHNALSRNAPLPETSALAVSAVEELIDVGLDRESEQMSAQLVNALVGSAGCQRFLADPSASSLKAQARFFQNLGELYWYRRDIRNAEVFLERSVALTETIAGPDSSEVALLCNDLGFLYYTEGLYAQAEPLFVRALAIYESVLGSWHPDVATSLNRLACLYRNQGRLAEAEPLFVRALAIWEAALGPDHRDVAMSLNDLAMVYQDQGRLAASEPLFVRALAILDKAMEPDHPHTLAVMENYARMLTEKGRDGDAQALLDEVAGRRERPAGGEAVPVDNPPA